MNNFPKYSLITLLLIAAFASQAKASTTSIIQPGFYFGGHILVYQHEHPENTAIASAIIDALLPFGAGGFAGYQFTKYFALQAGYNTYANDGGYSIDPQTGAHVSPDHYKLHSIDILAKGILPIWSHLALTGFGGAQILHEDMYNEEDELFTGTPLYPSPIISSSKHTVVMPEIGVGISVYTWKWLSIDLSVLHSFRTNRNVHSLTSVPLGITFHFY